MINYYDNMAKPMEYTQDYQNNDLATHVDKG